MYIQFLTQWCWFYPNWFVNSWDILLKHKKMLVFSPIFYVCAQIAAYFCLKPKKNYSIEKLMKRSVENWYYNLKLNENWRSYATLKLSYLKIMEVAISTRLEPAVPSISTNANSRGSIYHYTREIILIFLERGDLGEPDLLVSQAKFWHVHILYPPNQYVVCSKKVIVNFFN